MAVWCVVPAGGVGSRVGAAVPKQYLTLESRPLLSWTLEALMSAPIDGIALVVAPDDMHIDSIELPRGVRIVREGGASRAISVLAGLDALRDELDAGDLVLVHDAARPCLDSALVRRLIEAVANHADGGLLALPVADTVKRAGSVSGSLVVRETLNRSGLWLAQTPQAFPFARLRLALRAALARGDAVTDEASAIELDGGRPLLVPGSPENLKVTEAADLALAAFWLGRRAAEGAA